MGMAVILVMCPICHEQTFVPPTHRGCTQNLALIGQAVSEKMFDFVEGRTTNAGALVSGMGIL